MKILSHNKVTIKVSSIYNETMGKGIGGKPLFLDVVFKPEKHKVWEGEVVATGKIRDSAIPVLDSLYGFPRTAIKERPRKGDRVLFNNRYLDDKYAWEYEGDTYYQVPIEEVFAIIDKDSELAMVGPWCLITPLMETEDEVRTASGIYIKPTIDPKPLRGTIACIGDGIVPHDLSKGMDIYFKPNSEWSLSFGGVDYYVMHATDIFAYEHNGEWHPAFNRVFAIEDRGDTDVRLVDGKEVEFLTTGTKIEVLAPTPSKRSMFYGVVKHRGRTSESFLEVGDWFASAAVEGSFNPTGSEELWIIPELYDREVDTGRKQMHLQNSIQSVRRGWKKTKISH